MSDAVIVNIVREKKRIVMLNIFVFVSQAKFVNYLKFVALITAIITTGRGKLGKNHRVNGLLPREFVINCILAP